MNEGLIFSSARRGGTSDVCDVGFGPDPICTESLTASARSALT